MLWIKAFHIIFVICWFAGLFYLPRIFVNHAMVTDANTSDQLKLMEHKLYRFMFPLAVLAIALGFWLMFGYGYLQAGGGWLHAKLTLVLVLVAYHLYCGKLLRDFKHDRNTHSHTWFRWFNEVPVVLLCVVVILVVVKPF